MKSVRQMINLLSKPLPTIGLALLSLNLVLSLNLSSVSAAPGVRANIQEPGKINNALKSSGNNPTNPEYFYNWSGYVATASTPFTKVETSYIQPTVKCTVTGADSVFWTGFDGYNNGTVEQAGTEAVCGAANTTPTYFAWWEMYPTNSPQHMPITINPGDSIDVTVVYNKAKATYTMTVDDKTSKKKSADKATCASNQTCARDSADWIIETPTVDDEGDYAPLADWTSMNLATANASTSSKYLPISSYTNYPIDMSDYENNLMANVTTLNTAGNEFTDTWDAAQ